MTLFLARILAPLSGATRGRRRTRGEGWCSDALRAARRAWCGCAGDVGGQVFVRSQGCLGSCVQEYPVLPGGVVSFLVGAA